MAKESVVLKDKTYAAFAGGEIVHPLPVNQYVAAVRSLQPGNHAQYGCLSAAGWPKKPDEPPPVHPKIHMIRCLEITVMLIDIPEFYLISHDCRSFLTSFLTSIPPDYAIPG